MTCFSAGAAAGLAALALFASADTVHAEFLNSTDRGRYDLSGTHDPTNDNYSVGTESEILYRSFFVFDLSSLSGPLESASLVLFNPLASTGPATFSLHEVTTPIASLAGGTSGVAAFNDLADGTQFGSVLVSASDNGQFITIDLNPAGVAALNANIGGSWAIGGDLNPQSEFAFSLSGTGNAADGRTGLEYRVAQLNPVPAPSAAILAGIGTCSLLGFARLRRRAADTARAAQ